MSTCPYCGAQVADGAICACRYQQQPQQQYGQYDQQYGQYDQQYGQYDQQYGQYDQQYGQYDQQYGQYGQQPQQQYGQYGQQAPATVYGVRKQLMPGKTMIRVVGILLIIFGAAGIGIVISNFDEHYYDILEYFVGGVFGYFELLGNIVMLAVGIMATAMAVKKSAAGLLLAFGIVLIVLILADAIWLIAGLGDVFSAYFEEYAAQFILNVGGSLVLPILLVIGANTRKKAAV